MLKFSLEDEIQHYINIISLQRDSIISLESSLFADNYRQTLLLCLIDNMAKSVIYSDIGQQEKMKKFICEFCNWDDCTRVSLPHLIALLERIPKSDLQQLRSYAQNQFNKWPTAKPITLEWDPKIEDVIKLWPNNYISFKKIKPIFLTHVNLLVKLRNSLVHEMKPLGRAHGYSILKTPYYSGRIDYHQDLITEVLSANGYIYELYYPTDFLVQLINNALVKIKDFCLKNNINPFATHSIDSLWINLDY